MNAHAYIRVSSKKQDHAMQRAAIERIAAANGDTIVQWWQEKKSAKTIDRPELEALRVVWRAGNVPRLYVFKLDRLARSGISDTFELVKELRAAGVDLKSSEAWLDLSGPLADVILAIMAWAAQMERLAINERIAAARERVEASGGSWGRPRVRGDDWLARALAMRAEGRSVRDIAIALKVPRATVGRYVKPSQKDGAENEGSAHSRKPPASS